MSHRLFAGFIFLGARAWGQTLTGVIDFHVHSAPDSVARVIDAETLDSAQVDFPNALARTHLAPHLSGLHRVRKLAHPIHQQHRSAVHADISGVFEIGDDVPDEPFAGS